MADRQRHLWIGDWQRHQDDEDTVQILHEPAAAPPAREIVAAIGAKRRTRAWVIAAALGSATFAWSFGYILGEVRAGTDPGLRRISEPTSVSQQAQAQQSQGGFQQVPADPSAGQAPPGDQGLPPVTTRQS